MNSMYPYQVGLFSLNALVAFLVASIFWKRRRVPGGFSSFLLMIAAGIWAGSSAAEYASVDIARKIFWSEVGYLSIPYAGPLWFLFIMQYLERDNWITRRRMILFWTVPVLNMLLAFTNGMHGLVWPSIIPVSPEPGAALIYTHGPALWVDVAYSYTLMLIGTAYLVYSLVRFQEVYRHQAVAIIVSMLFPWIANILSLLNYFSHTIPESGLDFTPFAFTLTGAVLAFSIFRYHFLDLVPAARHTVFENIRIGVFVLDTGKRLVDFNPAAQELLAIDPAAIGKPAADTSRTLATLLAAFPEGPFAAGEQIVEISGSARSLHVRTSSFEHRGQTAGRVFVMQDITRQLQLEHERKEMTKSLDKALSDIETLRRFIPICSYCKKIRTDEGFWLQMESYIMKNTDFVFSHGICPDCLKKYFDGIDIGDSSSDGKDG